MKRANNICPFNLPERPFILWAHRVDLVLGVTNYSTESELRWLLMLSSVVRCAMSIKDNRELAIASIHYWADYVMTALAMSVTRPSGDREQWLKDLLDEGVAIACKEFGMPSSTRLGIFEERHPPF